MRKVRILITVIVPVYNAEKSIERCINSILNQTYTDIELLLIDDGSTDRSSVICEKYMKVDSRVRFVKQQNSGVSYTRNKGIKIAKGEFIQFVDSDDYINSEMCEKLIESAIKYNADMTMCGITEEHGKYLDVRIPKLHGGYRVEELREYYPDIFDGFLLNSPCNKLYKKESLTAQFPNDISLGEDLIFNLRNLINMDWISFIEESLYHYVIHQGSLNRSYRPNEIDCAEQIYIESMKFCNETDLVNLAPIKISQVFVVFLFYGLSNLYTLSSFSRKEKKAILKKWVNNKNVQSASKIAVVEKGYQKLALWMLKNKQVSNLNFLFTLRSRMR